MRLSNFSFLQGPSLDPRPIRLQLNARSPPRPGIDCIWACAVVAQVFAKKERIYLSKVERIETLIVYVSILTLLIHKELRVIGLFFASLVCQRYRLS